MFIDDATLIRAPSLLLFQLVHPLLQGFHHTPQDHRELLVIQSHQLSTVQVLGLAHRRAQLPTGLHVLGHEADLPLAAVDAVVDLRLHRIEDLLQLLLRDGPDVLLERPVAQVDEAVAEDHLRVVAAPDVGLDGQVRQSGGVVDELLEAVQHHPAAGECLELRHAVLVVGVEQQRSLSRRGCVPHHHSHRAVRGSHGDLLQQRREHRSRCCRPTSSERAGWPRARGPVAAGCSRPPNWRSGDAAARVKGARGGGAAHEELGEVQGAGRSHRDVPVRADAAVREAGQQSPVLLSNRHQGVLDLQVPRRAPELGGVHEARGREAVDRDVGRGGDPAAVLQGGYSGVDVVDGGPQTVEGCDQRIARVRLALRPTVAGDLEGAAVAQDGLGGERGLAQQVADAIGGALRLHQIDDAPSLSAAVGDEVPGVQGYEIAGPQEAAVRFGRTSCRFGCGAWTGSPESRRPSAALPGRGCG